MAVTFLTNEDEKNFTKTVNGTEPDENGNVTVEIPEIPEIPSELPNPNALTFTGAVEATYDGSNPVTVEIPSGGGVDVAGATVGQTVKITAVDEQGVPTAWAPADFPTGGSDSLEYLGQFSVEAGVSSATFDLGGTFKELYIFEYTEIAAVTAGNYVIYANKNYKNHTSIAKSINGNQAWQYRRFHIKMGMLGYNDRPWVYSTTSASGARNTAQAYGFGNYAGYDDLSYVTGPSKLLFTTEDTTATFNAVTWEIWGVRA